MKLVMDGCEQIYSFSNMAAQLRADQKPYVGSPANRPPNQKQQGAPRVATVTKTSAKRKRGKAKGKFERMRADASDDEDGGDDSDDDTVAPTPAAKGGKKEGGCQGRQPRLARSPSVHDGWLQGYEGEMHRTVSEALHVPVDGSVQPRGEVQV